MLKKIKDALYAPWNKNRTLCMILSIVGIILSVKKIYILPIGEVYLPLIFCGLPLVLKALFGFAESFEIKSEQLKALALLTAVIIFPPLTSGIIALVMRLFGVAEEYVISKANRTIEKIKDLQPEYVRVAGGGPQRFLHAYEVMPGMRIKVLTGETVPADGKLSDEKARLSDRLLSDTASYFSLSCGDAVLSGYINEGEPFIFTAEKTPAGSTLALKLKGDIFEDENDTGVIEKADRQSKLISLAAIPAAAIAGALSGEIRTAAIFLAVLCCMTLLPALLAAFRTGEIHEKVKLMIDSEPSKA